MAGDDEGFLARWSRRKHEAEAANPEPEAPAIPEPPDLAEIIARLPPIEDITAATDIRAFLAPGVPTHLRLAALRRAWSADPAIRDFIGLAENQWDFNAPDGVPGFGSLLDPEQVRRLLAKVVGGDEPEAERPAPDSDSRDRAGTELAAAPEAANPASPAEPASPGMGEAGSESGPESDQTTARQRRHGSALPQ
jgi:hypothetical protein